MPNEVVIPEGMPDNPLIPISRSALEVMERTQINEQIASAKQYPRGSVRKILDQVVEYSTIDEETAESCIYTLKRWNAQEQRHSLIQGESVRLAEVAVVCWKNVRAGSRTIENDGRKVVAYGICADMENNVTIFKEVARRITHSDGRPYSEDMQLMVAGAANSIAMRNAVFGVIPKAILRPAYHQILQFATGGAARLAEKLDKVFKRFYSFGVSKERILAVLGKESMEGLTVDDLGLLIGLGTAIKDKEITIEQAFATTPDEEEKAGPIPMGSIRERVRERREQRRREQEEEKF